MKNRIMTNSSHLSDVIQQNKDGVLVEVPDFTYCRMTNTHSVLRVKLPPVICTSLKFSFMPTAATSSFFSLHMILCKRLLHVYQVSSFVFYFVQTFALSSFFSCVYFCANFSCMKCRGQNCQICDF